MDKLSTKLQPLWGKLIPALVWAGGRCSQNLASLNRSTSCKTLPAAMLIINEADNACCPCSEPNIMTWVFISFKINSVNEESASSLWETEPLAQRGDWQSRSTRNIKSLTDMIRLFVCSPCLLIQFDLSSSKLILKILVSPPRAYMCQNSFLLWHVLMPLQITSTMA